MIDLDYDDWGDESEYACEKKCFDDEMEWDVDKREFVKRKPDPVHSDGWYDR
jgi:hypothetical protein